MALALVAIVAATAIAAAVLAVQLHRARRDLAATRQLASARSAIARELGLSQPLVSALRAVCRQLREGADAAAAFIVVGPSEMADPFGVADGVVATNLEELLGERGPIGCGFTHQGHLPLVETAQPGSREAALGLRSFCVAPLRIGGHVHGVCAIADPSGGFDATRIELVATAAEHIALALERYSFLAAVQRQASTDDLTGLHNHRFLVDYLAAQVALAERLGTPLALLMIDIDHFKALNDSSGHQAGDAALAAFAHTLQHSVRRSDLAARYGGEEFSVVMPNTTARDARLVAEKIRTAVAATAIELPDRACVSITVSVGGAAFPEDTATATELLAIADDALYRAKRSGRNRTCMAGDVAESRERQVAAGA